MTLHVRDECVPLRHLPLATELVHLRAKLHQVHQKPCGRHFDLDSTQSEEFHIQSFLATMHQGGGSRRICGRSCISTRRSRFQRRRGRRSCSRSDGSRGMLLATCTASRSSAATTTTTFARNIGGLVLRVGDFTITDAVTRGVSPCCHLMLPFLSFLLFLLLLPALQHIKGDRTRRCARCGLAIPTTTTTTITSKSRSFLLLGLPCRAAIAATVAAFPSEKAPKGRARGG
mmetsp:Transcript_11109/g.18179  ORF Transcript_11109/g.18179 Transcript_11109/m.18179 type:complete len:230 (-) Transcript_11109:2135-2824(-)